MTPSAKAWLALSLPPVAWFTFEQGLSAVLHADCTRTGIGVVWGLTALGLCVFAAHSGWRLRRAPQTLVSAWMARLALAVAGIFGLAIAFQTLAILIVPACAR
ncbi:hypothetical protein H5J25_14910 [Sphingomonas aliaeris]|uniref:Uncharacterized protein n=1 Tax=Sphingomonas aliaeris TaxID=2759526 RepID=A0A974NTM4_9SPHN|nr:hypothetical protein [Sphingomonas aliaeris]QQV76698.1 hypothetical protein H5J25_14910 [Sphingomonas aliaeris]